MAVRGGGAAVARAQCPVTHELRHSNLRPPAASPATRPSFGPLHLLPCYTFHTERSIATDLAVAGPVECRHAVAVLAVATWIV